jgi:hypothetical protein
MNKLVPKKQISGMSHVEVNNENTFGPNSYDYKLNKFQKLI